MQRIASLALLVMLLCGCSTPTIEIGAPGKVIGKLLIFWVGEDDFVYYPYYKDPLTFELPQRLASKLGTATIRPGAMYTDGGSIPPVVRGLAGFSPWGYGPAYIVHDWLFTAHHCIVHNLSDDLDHRDRVEVEKVRNVTFPDSANILADVIQALIKAKTVPARGFAPTAIYTAVDSGVARQLWDSPDPKSCHPVPEGVLQDIENSLRHPKALVPRFALPQARAGHAPVLVFQQDFGQ